MSPPRVLALRILYCMHGQGDDCCLLNGWGYSKSTRVFTFVGTGFCTVPTVLENSTDSSAKQYRQQFKAVPTVAENDIDSSAKQYRQQYKTVPTTVQNSTWGLPAVHVLCRAMFDEKIGAICSDSRRICCGTPSSRFAWRTLGYKLLIVSPNFMQNLREACSCARAIASSGGCRGCELRYP